MKVCYLITGIGLGGAERYLSKLVKNVGFESCIVSLTSRKEGKFMFEGKKIHYLGFNGWNLVGVIRKFFAILREEKPDVVDTYLIHSNIFGRLARFKGIKVINSVRNDYSNKGLLYLVERATRFMDTFTILNSPALESKAVIPNSIIPDEMQVDRQYDVRDEMGWEKDDFVVCCVANNKKEKNLKCLFMAQEMVKENVRFAVVGEGCPMGQRGDAYNIINSSDLFVLPSRFEGMSNALLEAMALRKCCLVSNIPQNRALIVNNINGLTFNPNKPEEMAAKIDWLARNREKARAYGYEAKRTVEQHFHFYDKLKEYERVIEVILE